MGRTGSWLKAKSPGLHRFLTRRDGRWPLLREGLVAVLVLLVAVTALYGLTGQGTPLGGGYPVVVVTTGSMMHCENYQMPGSDKGSGCVPSSWGRLGTIDPGDMVFVRAIDEASDVTTAAQHGDRHYGKSGDVVVYRPGGHTQLTPIIHRALFWVQVNADGTYTVPEFGLDHSPSLDVPGARTFSGDRDGCDLTLAFEPQHGDPPGLRPQDRSGFVTRGDNNPSADQCNGIPPARLPWVIGKARGEVPWIGLVNLLWGDIRGDSRHFAESGGDSKTMFFVTIGVVVATPWLVEVVWRRRRARKAEAQEAEAKESE